MVCKVFNVSFIRGKEDSSMDLEESKEKSIESSVQREAEGGDGDSRGRGRRWRIRKRNRRGCLKGN